MLYLEPQIITYMPKMPTYHEYDSDVIGEPDRQCFKKYLGF